MKKPSDHFTITFPLTHWIKNKKAYAWGSTAPSRALAYATLLILNKHTGPISREAVLDWAQRFKDKHPLSWHSTIVRMFSRAWNQDPRTEILCQTPDETGRVDGLARTLALSYFLLAAGLEGWPQFHEIYENTPSHIVDHVFAELKSWPGLELFYKEVELAILGQTDQVKWLNKPSGVPYVKGLYLRQVQALLAGDSMSFSAQSRGLSSIALQDKIKSTMADWSLGFGKKAFSVNADQDSVTVKRTR